jgi:HSP20 family protein
MTTAMTKRQNGNPAVSFGNVVDNIFQNSLRRFFDDNFWDEESRLTYGQVPVNVRETDHHYELDVIAPGCRKEDFAISIHEYVLRSFSRSFTLDDTVDVNQVNASYTNGILQLTLAKNEKAKKISRKIEIK